MVEFIRMLMSTALGLLIVGGLLGFIYRRHAEAWQQFQPYYGKNWSGAVAMRRMQNLLLYSKGDFARHYKGIVTLGVFPDGIGIRFMPILGAFHDPIFVPYTDIRGWKQKWYINAKSVELCFDKLPELRIIMPQSQIDWIAEQGFANVEISPEKPQTGNWPYATYISAIVLFVLTISLCIALVIKADGDWAEFLRLLGRGYQAGGA